MFSWGDAEQTEGLQTLDLALDAKKRPEIKRELEKIQLDVSGFAADPDAEDLRVGLEEKSRVLDVTTDLFDFLQWTSNPDVKGHAERVTEPQKWRSTILQFLPDMFDFEGQLPPRAEKVLHQNIVKQQTRLRQGIAASKKCQLLDRQSQNFLKRASNAQKGMENMEQFLAEIL